MKFSNILSMTLILLSTTVHAKDASIEEMKAELTKAFPKVQDVEITKTGIQGLYQVVDDNQVMYMTGDKKYLIVGDIFDIQNKTNITENKRSGFRVDGLKQLGEDNMLVFSPKGDVKHTITVFTDTLCPYCRKLHTEIDSYLNAGIKVRYIFLPFKGEGSFNQAVSVWCSKDKQQAYTDISLGKNLEAATCDNPISRHQQLGMTMGIQGTPAMVLADGSILPGYMPVDKLLQQLTQRGL